MSHEPATPIRHAAPSAPAPGARVRSNRRGLGLAGIVVLVFGLLLWAKLLLVTNHPRTAIATPPAPQTPATPKSAATSAPSISTPTVKIVPRQ